LNYTFEYISMPPEQNGGIWIMGTIRTYQRCKKCDSKFPSSKGFKEILCPNGCMTQPTKYVIVVYFQGKNEFIYCDRKGNNLESFPHASSTLGEIRADINRKGFDPAVYKKQSKTLFKTFWERYREGYKDKVGTYAKLKSVGTHLSYFCEMQMRDITPLIISDWWRALRESDISIKYRNDILQWLKGLFKDAHRLAVIEDMPRSWPDPETLPEKDIDWLTQDEQLTILNDIPEHDKPIFNFLFLTGVRVNEATGLQRSDIKWDKGCIIIQNTIKRDGSLGVTKNKKKRIIPIVQDIADCLNQKVHFISKYQFNNKWGRPYSDDYLRDIYKPICENKIGRYVPLKNGTRHSWGTQKAEMGIPMYEISKGLGHSDTKMTENYVKIVAKKSSGLYGWNDNLKNKMSR
jgi:integrase